MIYYSNNNNVFIFNLNLNIYCKILYYGYVDIYVYKGFMCNVVDK